MVPGSIGAAVMFAEATTVFGMKTRINGVCVDAVRHLLLGGGSRASAAVAMMEWATLDSTALTAPTSQTGVVTSV